MPFPKLIVPLFTLLLSRWLAAALGLPATAAVALVVVATAASLHLVRDAFVRPQALSKAVPAGLAVAVFWYFAPGEPAAFLPTDSPLWLVLRLALYCVLAPVVEELAFRAYALPTLEAAFRFRKPKHRTAAAIVVTALIFAVVHGAFGKAFVAGITYGLVYCLRRNATDAIVAHAVTNTALAFTALATGDWSHWG